MLAYHEVALMIDTQPGYSCGSNPVAGTARQTPSAYTKDYDDSKKEGRGRAKPTDNYFSHERGHSMQKSLHLP